MPYVQEAKERIDHVKWRHGRYKKRPNSNL